MMDVVTADLSFTKASCRLRANGDRHAVSERLV